MTAESTRLKFVLITLVLAVAADTTAKVFGLGWAAAAVITFSLNAAILGFAYLYADKLMAQLFVFGLMAGFAELPSDHYSVSTIGTLVYDKGGNFLWTSPLYMPFAYVVVLVQLGYLAYWMTQKWGLATATLLSGAIGGVNVPLYEYLAKGADYWYYKNCRMIFGGVPYYIVGGEIAFVAVLPIITSLLARAKWPAVAALGLLEGVVMFVGWGGTHWITG